MKRLPVPGLTALLGPGVKLSKAGGDTQQLPHYGSAEVSRALLLPMDFWNQLEAIGSSPLCVLRSSVSTGCKNLEG